MGLTQTEINEAFAAHLAGDDAQWLMVRQAIRDGEVAVQYDSGHFKVSVIQRPLVHAFGVRLSELRRRSGRTMADLADEAEMHYSPVIRAFSGKVLPHWHSAKLLIELMGGDPKEFRVDHEAARLEGRNQAGRQ